MHVIWWFMIDIALFSRLRASLNLIYVLNFGLLTISYFHLTVANSSILWSTLSRSHSILFTNISSMSNSLKTLFNSAPPSNNFVKIPVKDTVPIRVCVCWLPSTEYRSQDRYHYCLNKPLDYTYNSWKPAQNVQWFTDNFFKFIFFLFCFKIHVSLSPRA